MNYHDFKIASAYHYDKEALIAEMQQCIRPTYLCGRETPHDLSHITMGMLMRLQNIDKAQAFDLAPVIVMDVDPKELEKEPCEDVIGFSNFVANELRKIADLFASCRTDLTPEQEQAGFGNLNFGMFGVLDWYCKRMGITDHGEVEKVPWVRVYKCMDMDAQTRRCEQRLSEIQSNKLKRR